MGSAADRPLDIARNGIVFRPDEGDVAIWRPQGVGAGTWVSVPPELAQGFRLETGDVVTGPIDTVESAEPDTLQEQLSAVVSVNGLSADDALERPAPRHRGTYDRSPSDRVLQLDASSDDTARLLDLVCPLAAGYVGLVSGPHGSGLTRTLRSVVAGVTANAPDVLVMLLLARVRGEEVTAWRRRFPNAEVVPCPTVAAGANAEERARVADMVLACAQRQTELGCHVLLAVDTLTGVWANMLETENADAQYEADLSAARRRIREWIQAAGWFGGEGFLGGGLGGSLTIVGTAWQVPVDDDEEEELELHPHLRLFEHILDGISWHVPLRSELAGRRLYPAIDVLRCRSSWSSVVSDTDGEKLNEARRRLSRFPLVERHMAILDALHTTDNADAMTAMLAGAAEIGLQAQAPADCVEPNAFDALRQLLATDGDGEG